MRQAITRRRLLHRAVLVAAATLSWAAPPGARPGKRCRRQRAGSSGGQFPGRPARRGSPARRVSVRGSGAVQLGLRAAAAAGRAVQGHAGAGAGRGSRAAEGRPERGRLRQGDQRDPPRGRAPATRDLWRALPRSGELRGHRLRRAGSGGALGLPRGRTSPLAELHARSRSSRRDDAGVPGRESRHRPVRRTQGSPHPRPRGRSGTRPRPEHGRLPAAAYAHRNELARRHRLGARPRGEPQGPGRHPAR